MTEMEILVLPTDTPEALADAVDSYASVGWEVAFPISGDALGVRVAVLDPGNLEAQIRKDQRKRDAEEWNVMLVNAEDWDAIQKALGE